MSATWDLIKRRLDCQLIVGAAPTFVIAHENALVDQNQDTQEGWVLGALGDSSPLGSGEVSLESIQKPVEDLVLALVESEVLP